MIGVDRDPEALARAEGWAADFSGRLDLVAGTFGTLDRIAAEAGAPELDGVVLDVGVSSMQLDQAARGFSFQKDGPLDMRMSQAGPSAADLVNGLPEAALADLLYQLGEERGARRIARAVAADRGAKRFATTLELAGLIERVVGKARPGQPHAATRSFQALRIAVNDELGELVRGLCRRGGRASARWLARRGDLSLAGGPDREALPAARGRRRRRARAATPRRRRRRRRASSWRRARRSYPTPRKSR